MVAANPLSEQDLAAARTELAAGRPFTVWFTPAAVGVPAHGSAKVIAVEEVAEGDFIQVRPAGSRDTMFCSVGELTTTRPPRKRAQPPVEPPAQPAAQPSSPERVAEPVSPPPLPSAPLPSAPPPSAPPLSALTVEKRLERPRPAGGRPAPKPAEVTVTLNATAEGEWTVEVAVGRKRTVRPTPVQPAEVAKAARALPPAVAEAIESSLEAARLRQLERVERLRAELDAAQRALQELSS